MANYRRARTPGGTFFFTVVTYRRRRLFHKPESRDILREVIQDVRQRHPFTIDSWVLLPEHMHCIWTLPEENFDFSMRWSLIKSGFSKRAKTLYHVDERMNDSKKKHRETTIWQRRFWEHQIRDEDEYQVYMDYSFQSGKTRAGRKGRRLALFDVSSICQIGYLSRELGLWNAGNA